MPGNFFGLGNAGNQPAWVLDRWQKPGDNAPIQMYSTTTSIETTYYNASASEAQYTDASYIRLKNASLSWQLPDGIKKSVGLNGIRIFIQGQNLLTITKFKQLDPETKSSTTLPPLRILTFGLQVSM
jgi:hypothetical protein